MYLPYFKHCIVLLLICAGEDRWLCTLLLQRGYRVEYSAASDAYTHCPEGFNEFFNQRRRWVPSTIANIMDLLMDYKKTIKINDNISLPYIWYQVCIVNIHIHILQYKICFCFFFPFSVVHLTKLCYTKTSLCILGKYVSYLLL